MDLSSDEQQFNVQHLLSTNKQTTKTTCCFCALLLLLLLVTTRLFYWLYQRLSLRRALPSTTFTQNAATKCRERTVKTMVVLGSGGHTKEMLELTSRLNMHMYRLTFVTATTDSTSLSALLHKQSAQQQQQKYKDTASVHFDLAQIRRSREVGQSYITSCWSSFIAFLDALQLVCKSRPDLLLINGPGTCLPVCYAALFCELILFRPVKIVFIESFCRVKSLSLTGILVYMFVDRFIVMWKSLEEKYPKAQFLGVLY
eukprot:GHVS01016273.1.p1 GENE.GHVS01016273.1~~GHVS01016273.1.p1  ORF type:complete len:257 (-),score=29.11 GHVS01016273.1:174-944(-)